MILEKHMIGTKVTNIFNILWMIETFYGDEIKSLK